MSKCPVELRTLLDEELASLGLRYMLAMYWRGRSDKIPTRLLPLLQWITVNSLPDDVAATWVEFEPGKTAFKNRDHQSLLDSAMGFASSVK